MAESPFDLRGKVALVTGAARGQGEAEARLLAELGASVVLADVREPEVHRVAAEIGGHRAIALRLDVSQQSDWDTVIRHVVTAFGGLDILVNNAGIFRIGSVLDSSLDEYMEVVSINQCGTFLGMHTAAPLMVERGGGSIVNVSSTTARWPAEGALAYSATKAAICAMTKVAAMELGPLGIRVNAVLPGGIDTEMTAPGGVVPPFFDRIPLGRIGRATEVASVVAFLASAASSYCTGAEFVADGGWNAGNKRSAVM